MDIWKILNPPRPEEMKKHPKLRLIMRRAILIMIFLEGGPALGGAVKMKSLWYVVACILWFVVMFILMGYLED